MWGQIIKHQKDSDEVPEKDHFLLVAFSIIDILLCNRYHHSMNVISDTK